MDEDRICRAPYRPEKFDWPLLANRQPTGFQMPIRIDISTRQRTEWVEITQTVAREVRRGGLQDGAVLVYVPHTTAGLTINENADPSVAHDMTHFLDTLVPRDAGFTHAEGNSDAHIKASLMGSSLRVIVEGGSLQLGQWQGIFFCEFDGPRRRQVWLALEGAGPASASKESRES